MLLRDTLQVIPRSVGYKAHGYLQVSSTRDAARRGVSADSVIHGRAQKLISSANELRVQGGSLRIGSPRGFQLKHEGSGSEKA